MTQVCTRCLRGGTNEWLNAMRPLLVCGAGGACAELLLPNLCERRALTPLLLYLEHTPAISEEHLVLVLELTLKERQEASVKAKEAKEVMAAQASAPRKAKKISGPFGSKGPSAAEEAAKAAKAAEEAANEAKGWDLLLDRLISAPRNDVFLLQALRSLPMDDIISLLQRLLTLSSGYFAPPVEEAEGAEKEKAAASSSSSSSRPAAASSSTNGSGGTGTGGGAAAASAAGSCGAPNLAQIVGWVNVLIDAHFTRLLMHKSCHSLLTTLSNLARRHVKTCSSLKSLKGYLKQSTLAKDAMPAKPIPLYSVVEIDFFGGDVNGEPPLVPNPFG